MKYYKVVNPEKFEVTPAKDVIIEDPREFRAYGEETPGGIHYASRDILYFLGHGSVFCEVEPLGEIYKEPIDHVDYWKTSKMKLKFIGRTKYALVLEELLKDGVSPNPNPESSGVWGSPLEYYLMEKNFWCMAMLLQYMDSEVPDDLLDRLVFLTVLHNNYQALGFVMENIGFPPLLDDRLSHIVQETLRSEKYAILNTIIAHLPILLVEELMPRLRALFNKYSPAYSNKISVALNRVLAMKRRYEDTFSIDVPADKIKWVVDQAIR